MADLKFADYEREFIAKNKVDTIYYTRHFGKNFIKGILTDTLYGDAYNENGNIIYEDGDGYMNGGSHFTYDSLGFLKTITHHSCIENTNSVRYKFNADSLKLYCYWSDEETPRISYFDKEGRQIKKRINFYGFNFKEYYYSYNTAGRISNVEYKILDKNGNYYMYNDTANCVKTVTEIYYSNALIDSTYTKNYFEPISRIYTTKTYYDNRGLATHQVLPDGRVTYYKYIFRK